jgi:6-phosphogluconolactonase (cycloisomerase 2 family)
MSNKDFKVKNGIQPTVYHEAVGTVVSKQVGGNFTGATYDSVSFSVAAQTTSPQGMSFGDGGTKLYVIENVASNDSVYQYTLTTAYDISTASYASKSFDVSTQDATPFEVRFKPDGTKMYIVGNTADKVSQYTLSTAWDVSTASYDSVDFVQQDSAPTGLEFSSDGTKMYTIGTGADTVYQYTLTTAWDLSTAGYSSDFFSIASQDSTPSGVTFNSNGTKMYVSGQNTDTVYEYDLGTAWDVNTASYNSVSFSVNAQETAVRSVLFNSDDSKMYVTGAGTDTIYQYSTALNTAELDLSSGSVFDYTPTSDVQVTLTNPAASGTSSGATLLLDGGVAASYDIANTAYDSKSFDVGSQDTTPIGIHISTDGTKMFIIGNATDTVYEYNLSTPYDMSSASYNSVSLSVTSQASSPKGITFKSDGTKMYVLDSAVYQYALSTAWDLSTASYESKTLTISGQSSNARGIQLSNDGTSLFVGSIASTDGVFQYTLSTAFDISTGSYASKFLNVISQASEMSDFDFNSDGTKVFVVDYDDNDVHQYSLSTAFDISTASYDSIVFNPSEGGASSCRGMTFADSGNKLYQLINTGTEVYQYNTATPATITYPSTLKWPSGTAPTSPAIGETDVLTFNTTDGGTTYQAVQAIDGAK